MKLGSSFLVSALVTLSACSAGTQQVGITDPDGGADGGKGSDRTDGQPSNNKGPGDTSNGDTSNGGTSDKGPGDTSSPTGAKRIFVTSTKYTGNLGGVAGADAKCALVAEGANLGGAWKAWISDSTVDAIDRIEDVGPWYDIKGRKIFNNRANFATTPLSEYLSTEKYNGSESDRYFVVWTATYHGMRTDNHCKNWTTAAAGSSALGDGIEWSSWDTIDENSYSCANTFSLLCVEQ